jgi:PAS domain S-box-containing protein
MVILRNKNSILQRIPNAIGQALRQREEWIKLLFYNKNYAVITLDMEGKITSWNLGAEHLLGWEEKEVLGKHGDIIFSSDDQAKGVPEQEMSKALEEGQAEDERWHVRKDGSYFWGSGHMMSLKDRHENKIGLVKIFRDETQKKLLEDELQRSNKELEYFAYLASHDLKAPLSVIEGYTQILTRRYKDVFDEDAKNLAKEISDQVRMMGKMISGILEYAKVNTEKKGLSEVDCNHVFESTIEILQADIQGSGAQVCRQDLPKVIGNEAFLIELFQNLISNAIKYRKENEPPFIDISVQSQEGFWHFAFKDNGIGIKKEDLDKIFDIFSRGSSEKKQLPSGHGIGLAICKKIVELHGGKIWVESEIGQGSIFLFSIPKTKS